MEELIGGLIGIGIAIGGGIGLYLVFWVIYQTIPSKRIERLVLKWTRESYFAWKVANDQANTKVHFMKKSGEIVTDQTLGFFMKYLKNSASMLDNDRPKIWLVQIKIGSGLWFGLGYAKGQKRYWQIQNLSDCSCLYLVDNADEKIKVSVLDSNLICLIFKTVDKEKTADWIRHKQFAEWAAKVCLQVKPDIKSQALEELRKSAESIEAGKWMIPQIYTPELAK